MIKNKINSLWYDSETTRIQEIIKDNLPDDTENLKLLVAKLITDSIQYLDQYAGGVITKGKEITIPHLCMTAGENLCETLEFLGVGEDTGHDIKISDEVVEILKLK